MEKYTKPEFISLKNHAEINEKWIQRKSRRILLFSVSASYLFFEIFYEHLQGIQ